MEFSRKAFSMAQFQFFQWRHNGAIKNSQFLYVDRNNFFNIRQNTELNQKPLNFKWLMGAALKKFFCSYYTTL